MTAGLMSLKRTESDFDDDEGNRQGAPSRDAELGREIKLSKISTEKYRQLMKPLKQSGSRLNDHSALLYTSDGAEHGIRRSHNPVHLNTGATSFEDSPSSQVDDIPLRLVFNSSDYPKLLEKITGDETPAGVKVFVRPFKYLLIHEAKIRSALVELNAKHWTSKEQTAKGDESATDPPDSSSPPKTKYGPESTFAKSLDITERDAGLLKCLVQFMDEQMQDILAIRQEIAGRTLQNITFEYLLHLFAPGDLVLTDSNALPEERRAYRVMHVTGGRPLLITTGDERLRLRVSRPRSEIGGFEIAPDDVVSQGQQGGATKMTPLVVDCFYVDSDGSSYGPRPQRFIIPEFGGRKKVTDLVIRPVGFDEQDHLIHDSLRGRGQKFVDCVDRKHKEYHGQISSERLAILEGYQREYDTKSESFHVDCECIIDQKATLDRYSPSYSDDEKGVTASNKLGFHAGTVSRPTDYNDGEILDKEASDESFNPVYNDNAIDLKQRAMFVENTELLSLTSEATCEQLELLPLRVFGYALQRRQWLAFNVLHLTDPPAIKDNDGHKPFEDLVLPPKHKKTIQALVSYQVREVFASATGEGRRTESFDIVHGRGGGLVILLHGAPGVGKTSTAESVAIQLRRPLLPITAGDLGSNSGDVEEKLESYLSLGAKWRCVVLLDEADVFLARRQTSDAARNAIVSVFLRQMEYYSGILILTTNRVGEFDEAFVSRIHVKLHFPILNEQSTMEIWDMSLRRLKDNPHIDVRAKSVKKFAEEYWKKNENFPDRQWNGRQIKNAFQTAVALAYWDWEEDKAAGKSREKPMPKKVHFENVATTSQHFDEYMDNIYGTVGPTGRRRKGAFVREAERTRLRYDDPGVEQTDQKYTSAARGRYALQHTGPSRPSRVDHGTVADLQCQIAALRSAAGGQSAEPDAGATVDASDETGDEDSDEEDSDE